MPRRDDEKTTSQWLSLINGKLDSFDKKNDTAHENIFNELRIQASRISKNSIAVASQSAKCAALQNGKKETGADKRHNVSMAIALIMGFISLIGLIIVIAKLAG